MPELTPIVWFILDDCKSVLALLLLCGIGYQWKHSSRFRAFCLSKDILRLANILAVLTTVVFLSMMGTYLLYPGYVDHTQPTIASVSWLAVRGQPIYPNWQSGDVYGLLYGPILYILNGAILLLGPSIFLSKVLGVCLLIAALLIWLRSVDATRIDSQTRFFLFAALVAFVASYGAAAYSNRAEPILMFASVAAIAAGTSLPLLSAAIVVGILGGLAVGIKVHGVLYVAPAALLVARRAGSLQRSLIPVAVGCCFGVVAIVAPFFWSHTADASQFLQYLALTGRHGPTLVNVVAHVAAALVLLLPLFLLQRQYRIVLEPEQRWLTAGLVLAAAITVVPGSKIGSLPFHLLPLAPACFYAAAFILWAARTGARLPLATPNLAALAFLWFLASYGPAAMLQNGNLIKNDYANLEIERDKFTELKRFLEIYSGAQIEPSDTQSYPDSYYRAFAVFHGAALHIDPVAWMELSYGGADDRILLRFIEHCRVPFWIFPLGAPFTVGNFYTHQIMYSDSFQAAFQKNYGVATSGKYYAVWACRPE